jgi:methylase of polypeptide subunit release factors
MLDDSPAQAKVDQTPVDRLLARHRRHALPYQVVVGGLSLEMLPGVFCPAYTHTSELLSTSVEVRPGDRVLDLFCGSGYQGIAVADRAASVICTDHSPAAIACATRNIELNGVAEVVQARCGDLFSPVAGERFDVIIANPPLLPGEPNDMLETAVFDHAMEVSWRMLAELADHLQPAGRLYFMASDAPQRAGYPDVATLCASNDLMSDVCSELSVGYEAYTVYIVRRR